MAADYYLILGVASDATQDQIKSAYRRKVKELHPDHYAGGSGPFLAVQEAYDVLGDPARRRTYDDALAQEPRAGQPARGVRPEPLIPTQRSTGPQDPFFGASFPSLFDELLGHAWGDPRPWYVPHAPMYPEDISLHVSLTREQAMRGGILRIAIPTQVRCPACRGQGSAGLFMCPQCYGRGGVVEDYPVEVAFPAGIADGVIGGLALDLPGRGHVVLTLRFNVSPW